MSEAAFARKAYVPPSDLSQTWTCLVNRISLLARQRSVWALFLLVTTIPVLHVALSAALPGFFKDSDVSNVDMSYILAALPVVSALVSSAVCGSMVHDDHGGRTAYLTVPLPISRRSIYVGRFMAGFTICSAITLGAYGVAAAISLLETSVQFTPWIAASLVTSLAGTFFACSFAYLLGTCFRRGAPILSLALLAVAMPLAGVLLALSVPPASGVVGYVPIYAFDLSLDLLGGATHASVPGLFDGMQPASAGFSAGPDPILACALCIIAGIAVLLAGCRINDRRDYR